MAKTNPDRLILNVGRRVAEVRVARELTQAELAEKAGVSIKYIQRIEAGRCNLTLRSLAGLANVLNIHIAELLTPPRRKRQARGRPPGRT